MLPLRIRTSHQLLDERKEFDFPKGYSLKSGPPKRLKRPRDQGNLDMDRVN